MTFSKLQLTKKWTWKELDPNKPESKKLYTPAREYPAVCFGSIYVNEAHRFQRHVNQVVAFLRHINGWSQYELVEAHGKVSGAPKQARYIPAKWFVTGTSWERSPDEFAAASTTVEVEA